MDDRRKQFLAGVRAGLPIVLGYVPIGIAYAIIARQAGFTTAETVLMSLMVYGGARQMMAAGMLSQGAGFAAIVLATFVLNLRHLIMSVCVNNRIPSAKTGWRLLGAHWITDESFALFTTTAQERCTVWYFLGMGGAAYFAWALSSLLGALAMDLLPELLAASLGIALYAMFIALLLPHVRGNGRLGVLVLLTALGNALLGKLMPSSWALIASTLLGALAGVFFVPLGEEAADAA